MGNLRSKYSDTEWEQLVRMSKISDGEHDITKYADVPIEIYDAAVKHATNHGMMIYNAATKTSMPSYTHYPDEYRIKIKVGDLTDKISVKRKTYDRLEVGQKLKVEYSIGRLWIKLYIKSFIKPWKS